MARILKIHLGVRFIGREEIGWGMVLIIINIKGRKRSSDGGVGEDNGLDNRVQFMG